MSQFIIKKIATRDGKVEYQLYKKTFWGMQELA